MAVLQAKQAKAEHKKAVAAKAKATSNPVKNDIIWTKACEKEQKCWQSPNDLKKSMGMPLQTLSMIQEAPQDAAFYRVPMPGESVIVSGMRRRPELNGVHGEVVSQELDEFGRITVRVWNSTVPGHGTSKKMKIQPFRLQPSSSSPALTIGMGMDDGMSSVRSLSRPGSEVSFAQRSTVSAANSLGSRRLGTALSGSRRGSQLGDGQRPLSSAGRSAVSNTSSMRRQVMSLGPSGN